MSRTYLLRTGDALSQLGNVLFFNRESNHSICGDSYFYGHRRWVRFWDFVFRPIERDHCYNAHIRDVGRMIDRLVEHAEKEGSDQTRQFDRLIAAIETSRR